jgi:hypothetical protein
MPLSKPAVVAAFLVLGGVAGGRAMLACSSFSADTAAGAADGGGVTADGAPLDGASLDGASPSCDLATTGADPANCGRCGHSCLGGACANGACQPLVLGTSVGEPVVDLAVDATHVLWATSTSPESGPGHLWACPKSGCKGAAQSLAAPGEPVASLGGDGLTAFGSLSYGWKRVFQISAAGNLDTVPGIDHAVARHIQVVGGTLFYQAKFDAAHPGFAATAYSYSGGAENAFGSTDGVSNINDLAATTTGAVFMASWDSVVRCAAGTCAPFATGAAISAGIVRIAASDARLFVVLNSGDVGSCPVAGPCPALTTELGRVQLGSGLVQWAGVDHGRLYATTSTGQLASCDPSSCAATFQVLFQESRFYFGDEYIWGHGVVTDEAAIYWVAVDGAGPGVDAGDGSTLTHRVMKLAR